jgi:ABC-type uncharacterized transport system auxiliary subunit
MTRISLVVAALLLMTGCLPHKVQYYQLAAFETKASPADSGPAILVGRITTPVALQDGRIRYREGLNQVGAYEYHRWTDPPGIMVRDRLIQVMHVSGKYRSVQELTSSASGDYVVTGKLLDFSEVDSNDIRTHISLDLELRESGTGRMVWSEVLTHDDPVQAKIVSDVVQSLDRNLQVVLASAESAIGAYVAAHPANSRR